MLISPKSSPNKCHYIAEKQIFIDNFLPISFNDRCDLLGNSQLKQPTPTRDSREVIWWGHGMIALTLVTVFPTRDMNLVQSASSLYN